MFRGARTQCQRTWFSNGKEVIYDVYVFRQGDLYIPLKFLSLMVGSLVLDSFLHVINTAWIYFLMTVNIVGSSQYLFSLYVFRWMWVWGLFLLQL